MEITLEKIDKGMTEEELIHLCTNIEQNASFQVPYWTAEIYGFGKHIREYGFYPLELPLFINTDHGISLHEFPLKSELESSAPIQFYHSTRRVRDWKKVSEKPCYVMFSPFVFYRRNNNIKQAPDAKGTLAYPAHTTPLIDDHSDIELYIQQLKTLPEEYQPVSVCLHYHDINKGQHKLFLRHNIPVFTAGNPHDYRFTERFYEIIKNFKYTTSNLVMSCLFYSVEMDIPHFLYGNRPEYINKGDSNLKEGKYEPDKMSKVLQYAINLFTGMPNHISSEQKGFVEKELGVNDGVSRMKMAFLLRYLYYKYGDDKKIRTFKFYLNNPFKVIGFLKRKLMGIL